MDEAIATFYPLTLEHLLDLEDLWSGSSKTSETTLENELDNSSPVNMLDERDLRWARCQFNTLCAVAVKLGGEISNSGFANGIRRIMGRILWKEFHSGVNYNTEGCKSMSAESTPMNFRNLSSEQQAQEHILNRNQGNSRSPMRCTFIKSPPFS